MQAMRRAMRVRKAINTDIFSPICIYDVAEELNVRVRFEDYSSVEGIYAKGNPATIVISSLRPAGRRAFNCAHELGHHVFNHGDRFDHMMNTGSSQPEEFLADSFAGYLLMPPSAVNQAFTIRQWSQQGPSPYEVFVIAGIMGVGYSTLITHMTHALNILPQQISNNLQQVQPKDIRGEILGVAVAEDVTVVDQHWPSHVLSVDAHTGDYLVVPSGTLQEGDVVELSCNGRECATRNRMDVR